MSYFYRALCAFFVSFFLFFIFYFLFSGNYRGNKGAETRGSQVMTRNRLTIHGGNTYLVTCPTASCHRVRFIYDSSIQCPLTDFSVSISFPTPLYFSTVALVFLQHFFLFSSAPFTRSREPDRARARARLRVHVSGPRFQKNQLFGPFRASRPFSLVIYSYTTMHKWQLWLIESYPLLLSPHALSPLFFFFIPISYESWRV